MSTYDMQNALTEVTLEQLKVSEREFLSRYPGGFNNPEMAKIARKHKMDTLVAKAQGDFSLGRFESALLDGRADEGRAILDNSIALISKSTMVSLFEKPKFRDTLKSFSQEETQRWALGLKELLHGNQAEGFELLLGLLKPYGIAKWPILSAFRCYYWPNLDLLFKPTTIKGVIDHFHLEGMHYVTKPTYEFYDAYRQVIRAMAKQVDPSLSPTLAHFSGFLMVSMGED